MRKLAPIVKPRHRLVPLLAGIAAMSACSQSHAQLFRQRNDPVYERAVRDLQGQSYTAMGPRGRGYYTPMVLPGIDDFNGPSRAYSPIFNAPQAAPRNIMINPAPISEQNEWPRPANGAARAGLFRRVFRRR